MQISEFSIRKPITSVMVTLSVVVMGFIGLMRLPLQSTPDLSWPTINITSRYPSSSPEEVERQISQPLEEVMGTLPSLKSISTRSYGTSSRISLEFDHGTDMDLMFVHVRDRIDQVRGQLPDDLEQIDIYRWNSQDWPILTYTLTWKGDDTEALASIYEDVIYPRLQRINGVGAVEVEGLDEKALLVEVDQDLMNSYRMDIRSLNWAIRSNNINHSAGHVEDAGRRLSVRTVGEFERVEQIRTLPIRGNIQLGDVANVTYDYPEKDNFERMDGRDAVTVEIRQSSSANLVATAERVRYELDRIQEEIGDRLIITTVRDRSVDVTQGISNLAQSAALGGILAIAVIFIFLRNFRSTLIIGSAIPISVLCVFIMMYFIREFFGSTITLNLVSMMGLMVAIGMLVDPAVVALENIFRKRFYEGLSPMQAALEGSREIGMPVLAAALTTICVFVPLIFVDDVSGNSLWMRDFAVTVVISVIASLAVALSLVPLAGSRAFNSDAGRVDRILKIFISTAVLAGIIIYFIRNDIGLFLTNTKENIIWLVGGLGVVPVTGWVALGAVGGAIGLLYFRYRDTGIKELYVACVKLTLRYRWTTIAGASIVLAIGFHIYGLVEQQPFRWQPSRRVDFQVEVPRSHSLADNLELFQMVEGFLIPRKKELDIKAVNTRFGEGTTHRITLHLIPAEESTISTDDVKEKVKELFPTDIPGVQLKSGRAYGGGGGSSVSIELKGRDPQVLAMLAEDISLRMDGIRGVQEVETSLETGTEEIQVTVNRDRAQRYGLSPRDIAGTLASALGTRGSSKFKTDEKEIDITVLLREEDRATLEELKNTSFESAQGTFVSFATLADFTLKKAPNTLRRDDRIATVQVIANTEQWARFSAGREMEQRMGQIALPSGYTWEMGRSHRWARQEQEQNNFTMFFAALLIYLIMAALFESYIHPFTILFTIGFAFIGVAIGLYSFNVPMDSSASYGLLILFGIVVNNGIVLVDHINRYRKKGLFRRDAIIRGGQDRLRPILMTATTTILGLTPLVIPMIYGTAEGNARRWGPIGLVVISGLSFSTILTLVLLPTVYSLMDDLGRFMKRVFASARTA